VDARDHTISPAATKRSGYAPDVLQRALSLLVAAFPPESRGRAVGEMMRALEELHAREGVACGVDAAPPNEIGRAHV